MMHSRKLWSAVIFVLALALRLWFLSDLNQTPYGDRLMIDAAAYDRHAAEIAGGNWAGDQVFYQSPLYPYFLGSLYTIFGRDFTAVRAVQSVLGSATCVLLFLLTTRLYGTRAGVVAGLLAATYSTFIFQDNMLLKSVVILFFVSLALLVLSRTDRPFTNRVLFGGGLLYGIAVCGRGNLLLALPFLLAWIALRDRAKKRRIVPALVFLVGVFLAIAPVTARNRVVGNDWVMTESDAGINLFVGNNPAATGVHTPPDNVRTVPEHEETDAKRLAERESGRALKPSEVSAFWMRKAIRFALENPGRELGLIGRKFVLAWNWYEVPDNYNQYFFGRFSPLFRGFLPAFQFIAPFGVLGFALSCRRWRETGAVLIYTFAYLFSLLVLYVTSRYRLPIAVGLIPLAAFGLVSTWDAVRKRSFRQATIYGTAVLAVWLFVRTDQFEYYGFAKQDTEIATFYAQLGDFIRAEEHFQLAIQEGAASGSLHLVYLNQGILFAKTGRTADAAEAFRNALRVQPDFYPARAELERLPRTSPQ